MKLSTITVENWYEFSWKYGIKFHCACLQTGQGNMNCLECFDARVVFPSNPTAYDTGYEVAGQTERLPYVGVVAFEHQGRVWLGTRLRDEVDPAPFLASAWLRMFPKSQWLPEQFVDVNSVPDYYKSLPKHDADAIVAKLKESLELTAEKSRGDLERLAELTRGG